ncbi:hypothetical protein K2O51_10235 [Cupriavidus pinatubonensis]|nr:hypothetical protein K2O51_10235 [Cupriavidus pinatubonensis]
MKRGSCGEGRGRPIGTAFRILQARRLVLRSAQMKKPIYYTCQNQSCGTRWESTEVVVVNEGQGPLFRCPICGARNVLAAREEGGVTVYRQRRTTGS